MYKLILLVAILILILVLHRSAPEYFNDYEESESNEGNEANISNNDISNNNIYNNTVNENGKKKKFKKIKMKRVLCNIIPGYKNNYIGTFFPEVGHDSNTLVMTRSLESNRWMGPIVNGAVDEKSVIVDLTYDKDRHLMCVAMSMNDEGESVFKIYKKESEDIKSKWSEIYSTRNMRSITFDTDGKLMGCGEDGQIYKKLTEDYRKSEWDGPINFDKPMKKIFFDKDLYLLGIGLNDNKLYKKRGFFWSEELWDEENVNNEEIFDAFHHLDGRLIATSHRGLLKQKDANFMSPYYHLSEVPKSHRKNKKILNFNDTLYFRTGLNDLEPVNIVKNTSEEGLDIEGPLKRILEFKKNAKKVCSRKGKFLSKRVSDNYSNILLVNKQAKTIDKLEDMISKYENANAYTINENTSENSIANSEIKKSMNKN